MVWGNLECSVLSSLGWFDLPPQYNWIIQFFPRVKIARVGRGGGGHTETQTDRQTKDDTGGGEVRERKGRFRGLEKK